MINKTVIIAEIFVYIADWEKAEECDICLRGLNGNFEMDMLQEMFKQFESEPPTQELQEAISKEHGNENETMYTVFVEIDHNGGEYGDYGEVIYDSYYWIGKVLRIEKHEIIDPWIEETA